MQEFDLSRAFSRNIGWLTESEQKTIHQLRVGLVGLGGVGGAYAEILARLGVCHFVICDHDRFSMETAIAKMSAVFRITIKIRPKSSLI